MLSTGREGIKIREYGWCWGILALMCEGHHECEVLGPRPEAAESMYEWERCTKNPGHTTFIPASDFCLDNLPIWCRRTFVLDIVKATVTLTVRLRVNFTSRDRPRGYSFYNFRGSDILHTGTGCVWAVEEGQGPCECRDCKRSPSPCQKWYQIFTDTACHVVFNTEEALQTKVDFFYDDEGSRLEGRMKSVWASQVVTTEEVGDTCTLLCNTHDEALAEKLRADLLKIQRRPQRRRSTDNLPSGLWRLCVVVSHPHGQPKRVTVGQGHRQNRQIYTYIADTCPGSSGAPVLVFVPDNELLSVSDDGAMTFVAPHSQCLVEENFNLSGFGRCLASPYRIYLQSLRANSEENFFWSRLISQMQSAQSRNNT